MSMCEWSVLTEQQKTENLMAVIFHDQERGPHQRECLNPNHDHDGYDDVNGSPTGERMHCNDCDAPCHYDIELEDYRHDDEDTPPCFLIPHWNTQPDKEI